MEAEDIKMFFQKGSHHEAQVGLQFTILLPQSPEGCDYRRAPPGQTEATNTVMNKPTITFCMFAYKLVIFKKCHLQLVRALYKSL
jgi:hypothetical protein